MVNKDDRFKDYHIFLISGTILEPRRQEIINAIKEKIYQKTLVITTQVIEAGVDIDMDIGFKDRSLVDSDEQLAGRVNRNASKNNCKVFIFNYDREVKIYGKDKRYDQEKKLSKTDYEAILNAKDFDKYYDKVHGVINKLNKSEIYENLHDYLNNFKQFNFRKIDEEFKLIDTKTISVFVPLSVDKKCFSANELSFLSNFEFDFSESISGASVFRFYEQILKSEQTFLEKIIDKKQIAGLMSKFIFSIYSDSSLQKELLLYSDSEKLEDYGLMYLSHWEEIYSYKNGLSTTFIKSYLII
jgi:CRISPR-associated endonuclease/helicase Cas3